MRRRFAWKGPALLAVGLTGCGLVAGLGEATPAADGGAATSGGGGSSGNGGNAGNGGFAGGGSSGSGGSFGTAGQGGSGASTGGGSSSDGGGGTAGAYAGLVLADQPLAYWRLGELFGTTASDSAGKYHGVYKGFPALGVPGAISGDTNTAVRFTGKSPNNVQLGDVLDLDGTSFSIELWIKPLVVDTTYRGIIAKSVQDSSTGAQLEGWWLSYQQNQGLVFTMLVAGKWHGVSTTLPMNLFSHIVLTYEFAVPTSDSGPNGKLTLYVDKIAVDSADAPPLTNTDALLVIGAASNGYTSFNGEIDEVAIYPTALPVERIQAHYAAGTD